MLNITEDHVSPNTGSTLGALIKIIVMLILGLSTQISAKRNGNMA
jgi:NNP family nitrate/nitrite transporter-like MFS transporter